MSEPGPHIVRLDDGTLAEQTISGGTFPECEQAERHAKDCGCVVLRAESDKWNTLAGELAAHLVGIRFELCVPNRNYPLPVINAIGIVRKGLAKAREAGL